MNRLDRAVEDGVAIDGHCARRGAVGGGWYRRATLTPNTRGVPANGCRDPSGFLRLHGFPAVALHASALALASFYDDVHFNEEGSRRVARILAEPFTPGSR